MTTVRSDEQAAKIFLENIEYIRRVARLNAPQADMVEDVVNDAFVLFMSRLEKWDMNSPGIRGLLGVLTRQCAFRMRHANRTLSQDENRQIYDVLSDRRQWSSDFPYEEERNCLAEIVKKLLPHHREMLHLYYYEKVPIREIAKRLGMKEDNVCRMMSRLRLRLRRMIDERLGRRGES